ncbi:hypothetical protein SAMN02910298_01522 [Pseudobutyrivibrio sp. YE44]|uniref:hypothetical protein n=1 Tax=Pseudobutyrivibrio sp. YE44 TaxID=1520802 RepID=UPI000888C34C|nr:hypothetical protein [Pseudobutyrivibrio sp. YE44]SDB30819.1 hypothetical protein SAMN02910298_01522 [Pseudobutyrivibrio sp. YE44]
MNNFIIEYLNIEIGLICLVELGFIMMFLKQFFKEKNGISLCMLLVAVGLFLDAFLIAIGSVKPEGISENVSRVRFLAHGLLIPLMFPICGYALGFGKKAMRILWAVTAVIMVIGLAQGFAVKLEPEVLGKTYRHVSSDATPMWAEKVRRLLSFGTVIPVIIVGIYTWVKKKNKNIFLAGLLMFVFSAVGPATGNFDLIFFFSMIGEVFLCLFFYRFLVGFAKV